MSGTRESLKKAIADQMLPKDGMTAGGRSSSSLNKITLHRYQVVYK
jgi:hypothetical protein